MRFSSQQILGRTGKCRGQRLGWAWRGKQLSRVYLEGDTSPDQIALKSEPVEAAQPHPPVVQPSGSTSQERAVNSHVSVQSYEHFYQFQNIMERKPLYSIYIYKFNTHLNIDLTKTF